MGGAWRFERRPRGRYRPYSRGADESASGGGAFLGEKWGCQRQEVSGNDKKFGKIGKM